jgi:hypothetical protein
MPPLWQYFWRTGKALEPICAPKGVGPSAVTHCSCKAATSEGAAMGASVPIMDPRSWRRPRLCGRARGGGHAPVVAVLLAAARKTA